MKQKKWIKYILSTGLLVLVGYTFILFQHGRIDFQGTFSTRYHKIEKSTDQIIETDFFKLKTSENWIHLFGGYGMEGDPFGAFQTGKGVIYYEYGHGAPSYDEDANIYGYIV